MHNKSEISGERIFRKDLPSGPLILRLKIFDDGSAYVHGEKEVIFEGSDNPTESALAYIRMAGYTEILQ